MSALSEFKMAMKQLILGSFHFEDLSNDQDNRHRVNWEKIQMHVRH